MHSDQLTYFAFQNGGILHNLTRTGVPSQGSPWPNKHWTPFLLHWTTKKHTVIKCSSDTIITFPWPGYATSMWQYCKEDLLWSSSAVVRLVPYFLLFRAWNLTQAHDSDLQFCRQWRCGWETTLCVASLKITMVHHHCNKKSQSFHTTGVEQKLQNMINIFSVSSFLCDIKIILLYIVAQLPMLTDICTNWKLIQLKYQQH